MNENRSTIRKTYAWVTETDAQLCRDALKKAGYIIDGNCVTPNNNDEFSHQVFGDGGWVSYAERVGVIQFPSDEEMLRPRDSHQADALRYAVGVDCSTTAMPDVPEECSHGPWIDEGFGSWVCIRYGLSLYVWESGDDWYFVEHVSDTIQRRLDALSEENAELKAHVTQRCGKCSRPDCEGC